MTDADLAAIEGRVEADADGGIFTKQSIVTCIIDREILLAEVKRLTAITERIRTCYACAKPYVSSRAVDFEEEEPEKVDDGLD